jgi:hypothetical protein
MVESVCPPFFAATGADESHSQVFPLYADVERLPSKNSTLARIRQKRTEIRNSVGVEVV